MKSAFLASLVATGLAAMPAAAAVITYKVTDTPVVNCTGSPHGLWTNSAIGGGTCSGYFSLQPGSTFSIDTVAGTGAFDAVAINPQGLSALI